ncbi:MAG: biopolymer transporter ExbD [bacterium]
MAFAPSKGKKHLNRDATKLHLTSMMDMMVIMLLFLLKTYTVSGHLIQPAEGVELPSSTVTQEPMKILSFIITPEGLFEDLPMPKRQLIEDVASLQNDNGAELERLNAYLNEIRERDRHLGRTQNHVLTVQGDKSVPYSWLLKVINTCSEAGFEKIDFVVYKKSKYRG